MIAVLLSAGKGTRMYPLTANTPKCLIDIGKGKTRELNFLHYSLFVTFFPQLIAGPIVHHKEMLPQFKSNLIYQLDFKKYQ